MKHRTRNKHSCGVLGCGTDQVWTHVCSKLREAGGPIWQDELSQADIMAIIVTATREYDRNQKRNQPRRESLPPTGVIEGSPRPRGKPPKTPLPRR